MVQNKRDMTKQELEKRLGLELSEIEFDGLNAVYMESPLDKDAFAKVVHKFFKKVDPTRVSEADRRHKRERMSNREKALVDMDFIVSKIESNFVKSDWQIEKTEITSDIFDIWILIRERGLELYKSEWDRDHGRRAINLWSDNKYLYHLVGKDLGAYYIDLVKKY